MQVLRETIKATDMKIEPVAFQVPGLVICRTHFVFAFCLSRFDSRESKLLILSTSLLCTILSQK